MADVRFPHGIAKPTCHAPPPIGAIGPIIAGIDIAAIDFTVFNVSRGANGGSVILGARLRGLRGLRGISLIEMAVVISILGIVVAAGAPAFSTWMANSQIRSTAESIQSGLQLARAEAVRRNTNVGFELRPTQDVLWRVCCTAAGQALQQQPLNQAANIAITPSSAVTYTFNGIGRVVNWNSTWGNVVAFGVNRPSTDSGVRNMQVELGSAGTVRTCHPSAMSGTRCSVQVQ